MEKLIGTEINGATAKTTIPYQFPSTGAVLPDVGHALLAVVRTGSSNTMAATPVTDPRGNVWTLIGGSGGASTGGNSYMLTCTPSTAYQALDTITFTATSSNAYMSVVIAQWPAGSFSTLDGAITVANALSSATSKSITATPPRPGDICITTVANGQTTSGTVSVSPTTGTNAFDMVGSTLNCGVAELTTPWTSGASPNPTWTWNVNSAANLLLAYFTPTAGGSGVANAGPDQTVPPNTVVTLDGSHSTGVTTYNWTCLSGPHVGNTLTGVNPTYTATIGVDVWRLTDPSSGTTDTVTITCTANVRLVCIGLGQVAFARHVTLIDSGFPSIGVLDSFTRADSTLSTGNWLGATANDVATAQVISDAAGGTNASWSGSSWVNTVSLAIKGEIYATLAALPGGSNDAALGIYQTANTSSIAGYYIWVDSGGVTLYREDGFPNFTTLHSWALSPSAGDQYGISWNGAGKITVYRNGVALGHVTDATHLGTAYLSLEGQGTAWRWDDFGGGNGRGTLGYEMV